jgi:hypothetical protein
MIVEEVTRNEWIDAFVIGRCEEADFSYEAADALYDHYSDIADETGENVYLDRAAVRCFWVEYTEDEVREQYKVDYDEDVEVALVDRGLVSYAIKVPMHGRPHHYLVMD